MKKQTRIRDYGVTIGLLPTGEKNAITDVKGVLVGHHTLQDGPKQTGVTTIKPHNGNLFKEKVVAAAHVFNGFGKTMGIPQIEELGTIETPIVLTNTLSIGTVAEAVIERTLKENPEIGRTVGTVNPIIGECNDMLLNNIRASYVHKQHVFNALDEARAEFEEGSVGAGTGMVCMGMKGGIGTSSRIISLYGKTYSLGVLVLTNFGRIDDFIFNGNRIGAELKAFIQKRNLQDKNDTPLNHSDKGSIMMIVATDLPVTHRQLKRIIKRAGIGLGRTGAYMGNGSGDIVLGFSTANRISYESKGDLLPFTSIHDNDIDGAFHAVADTTEEAILNSLITAKTTTGRDGRNIYSLNECIKKIDY